MQFDFGENWLRFAKSGLTKAKVIQAEKDFKVLLGDFSIKNKSFLEIGFGQGLSFLLATKNGARVTGIDINPGCEAALQETKDRFFPELQNAKIKVIIGSILDPQVNEQLKKASIKDGGYDVVHSWGVLHHTGAMWLAIENVIDHVKGKGLFIVSIYNRHWSSPIWRAIKYSYCRFPHVGQKILILFFFPIVWLAKLLVTRRNPLEKDRGMDFFYDLVDWVGGYPYEYASMDEVEAFLQKRGFTLLKSKPAQVPTGCNEFVFQKTADKKT